MQHLVIGLGEVGLAIQEVFACKGIDKDDSVVGGFDVLHICFPYSEKFVEQVNAYTVRYQPQYTVVHSTVPMGTCEALRANHAPVRGKHPRLEESLRTFVMFIGGPNAEVLKQEFEVFGISCEAVADSKTTESLKLWDLCQYGLGILTMFSIFEFCKKHGVDFNIVYTMANLTYRDGYAALGMPDVARPILSMPQGGPAPIGGHCIVPVTKMLADMHDSPLAELVVVMDRLLKEGKSLSGIGIKTF